MSVSVSMPQLGESVTEGTVTRWLKKEGERVEADEPLLEVSTDKVDTEIPSPAAGVLRNIAVGEDETVEVGAQLAEIEEGADAGRSGAPSGSAPSGSADSGQAPAAAASAPGADPGRQCPGRRCRGRGCRGGRPRRIRRSGHQRDGRQPAGRLPGPVRAGLVTARSPGPDRPAAAAVHVTTAVRAPRSPPPRRHRSRRRPPPRPTRTASTRRSPRSLPEATGPT